MRTKWIGLLAAAVCVCAVLSACGSSSSGSSSSSSSSGGSSSKSTDLSKFEALVAEGEAPVTKWPADAPTEPVKKIEPNKLIVDISLSPEEAGGLAIAEGVEEAAQKLHWRSKVLYGYGEASKTTEAFEQAVALKAEAVVTQGINPGEYKGAIKKLHEAGGVLITTSSDYPLSAEYAQAEIDEHSKRSGELAAAKAVVESGGKGTFALFNYPQYTVLNNRLNAAKKVFEECSGCKVLETINTNAAEAEKTLPSATSTLLERNPDLTGLVNGIDNMVTSFQLPVLRQQHSSAAVYTFLGGRPTMEALKKGEIKAVIVDPLVWEGWAAVDNAARLFDHQPVNDGGMPDRIIDQKNVSEALSTAAKNGFWDADGFNYRGEYEKLWGLK